MNFALPGGHTRPCILLHEPEASVEIHQEEDEDLLRRGRLQGQEIGEGDDACRGKLKFSSRLAVTKLISLLFLQGNKFK